MSDEISSVKLQLVPDLQGEKSTTSLKRIATLDFQRGIAIWLMVFLHVFNHIYDYSWVVIETLFDGSVSYVTAVIIIMMGFFGGWAGYFVLISGVSTGFASTKSSLKNHPSTILRKRILTGIGILIAGFITEGFGYYGYFGRVFRSGYPIFSIDPWQNSLYASAIWRRVFMFEALQIIGWCEIINALVQFFLTRKNGAEKYMRNIIIYGVLTALIFILTPIIWNWIDNLSWIVPDAQLLEDYGLGDNPYHLSWPSELIQSENAAFGTYWAVFFPSSPVHSSDP